MPITRNQEPASISVTRSLESWRSLVGELNATNDVDAILLASEIRAEIAIAELWSPFTPGPGSTLEIHVSPSLADAVKERS